MAFITQTSDAQEETLSQVLAAFETGVEAISTEIHAEFLSKGIEHLPRIFSVLDASRPWFVYWTAHALDLLGRFDEVKFTGPRLANFIDKCQMLSGGFGGGPCQLAHLAPTFAATCTLVIANEPETVDRVSLVSFLMNLKDSSGGFRMHEGGEADMRGTYCAIAVASLLGVLTKELTHGVADYVLSCITYEGGIAGDEGGLEAHGGYGYCGLATLGILSRFLGSEFFTERKEKLDKILWWVCQRQMSIEGGFNGRANKLVDSCYSFWQGASLVILRDLFEFARLPVGTNFWLNQEALEKYIVCACQCESGGLRDKPGKNPDYYHSCYALSGLAVVKGQTHPLYNIRFERIGKFREKLEKLPVLGFSGYI